MKLCNVTNADVSTIKQVMPSHIDKKHVTCVLHKIQHWKLGVSYKITWSSPTPVTDSILAIFGCHFSYTHKRSLSDKPLTLVSLYQINRQPFVFRGTVSLTLFHQVKKPEQTLKTLHLHNVVFALLKGWKNFGQISKKLLWMWKYLL